MLQTDGTHSGENSKQQGQGDPHVLKSVLLGYEIGNQIRDCINTNLVSMVYSFFKTNIILPIIADSTETFMPGERVGSGKIGFNGLKTLGFGREST